MSTPNPSTWPSDAGTQYNVCTDCAVGRFGYIEDAVTDGAVGQGLCKNCMRGTYVNEVAQLACTKCALGETTFSAGSVAVADCTPCAKGSYGHESPSDVDNSPELICSLCPMGQYSGAPGYAEANASPTLFKCDLCPVGSSTPGTNTTSLAECTQCSTGQYETDRLCSNCPQGSYFPAGSAGLSTDTYNTEPYSSELELAVFNSQDKPCAICKSGTIQDAVLTECADCPAGKQCCWAHLQGSQDGKYALDYAATFTTSLPGASPPDECYADFTESSSSSDGYGDPAALPGCPVGRYGGAGESCKHRCPVGTYGDPAATMHDSSSYCLPCTPGYFCPGETSKIMNSKLVIGYGSGGDGRFDCRAGTYCPAGSTQATDCPAGTSTKENANQGSPEGCVVCSAGKAANGLGNAECTACDSGEYAMSDGMNNCAICLMGEFACPGAGRSSCAAGYTDNKCGKCDMNYYAASGKCMKCASSFLPTLVMIIVAVALAFVVSKVDLTFHLMLRLKIYSTFLSVLSLVTYVEVPWPDLATKFVNILRGMTMNIEFVHPECQVDFDMFQKLQMVVGAPFLAFFGLLVVERMVRWRMNYVDGFRPEDDNDSASHPSRCQCCRAAEHRSCWFFCGGCGYKVLWDTSLSFFPNFVKNTNEGGFIKGQFWEAKWKNLRQLMVIFVTSVYSPVCYYSMKMFEPCIPGDEGDGSSYMKADVTVKCHTTRHELHASLAWAALLVFGVGIPIAIVLFVKHLKDSKQLAKPETQVKYGGLYEWYCDGFRWWEAASLTRRGVMLLTVTLIQDPTLQAVAMCMVTLSYSIIIMVCKPFFNLQVMLSIGEVKIPIDFYNFCEAAASGVAALDLLLGVLAAADKTREMSSFIGLTFVVINTSVVVAMGVAFERVGHQDSKDPRVHRWKEKALREECKVRFGMNAPGAFRQLTDEYKTDMGVALEKTGVTLRELRKLAKALEVDVSKLDDRDGPSAIAKSVKKIQATLAKHLVTRDMTKHAMVKKLQDDQVRQVKEDLTGLGLDVSLLTDMRELKKASRDFMNKARAASVGTGDDGSDNDSHGKLLLKSQTTLAMKMPDWGVQEIADDYEKVLCRDALALDFAEKWFVEKVQMTKCKYEKNYGEAHALKQQLTHTCKDLEWKLEKIAIYINQDIKAGEELMKFVAMTEEEQNANFHEAEIEEKVRELSSFIALDDVQQQPTQASVKILTAASPAAYDAPPSDDDAPPPAYDAPPPAYGDALPAYGDAPPAYGDAPPPSAITAQQAFGASTAATPGVFSLSDMRVRVDERMTALKVLLEDAVYLKKSIETDPDVYATQKGKLEDSLRDAKAKHDEWQKEWDAAVSKTLVAYAGQGGKGVFQSFRTTHVVKDDSAEGRQLERCGKKTRLLRSGFDAALYEDMQELEKHFAEVRVAKDDLLLQARSTNDFKVAMKIQDFWREQKQAVQFMKDRVRYEKEPRVKVQKKAVQQRRQVKVRRFFAILFVVNVFFAIMMAVFATQSKMSAPLIGVCAALQALLGFMCLFGALYKRSAKNRDRVSADEFMKDNDKDGNCKLDRAELKDAISHICSERPSDQDIDDLIKKYDANGDGWIQGNELSDMLDDPLLTSVMSVSEANTGPLSVPTVILVMFVCTVQLVFLHQGYGDSFRLSLFRTAHEIPAEWRRSESYQRGYADWFRGSMYWSTFGRAEQHAGEGHYDNRDGRSVFGPKDRDHDDHWRYQKPTRPEDRGRETFEQDGAFVTQCSPEETNGGEWYNQEPASGCAKRGSQETSVDTEFPDFPVPFDYTCSEVNNVIVSNATEYTWGWPDDPSRDDTLPTLDESKEYLAQHAATHMYGQCGSCSRSPSERLRAAKFDVALFEEHIGRNPVMHNCMAEMHQKTLRRNRERTKSYVSINVDLAPEMGEVFDHHALGYDWYNSNIAFFDANGDGLADAFIGGMSGNIKYYRNDGPWSSTNTVPRFSSTDYSNPFKDVDVGEYSTIAFFDANGDGLMDAFIGERDGNINYFRNDGTSTAPSFTKDADNNPFKGVDVGAMSNIAFFDTNGNGMMDAFIGEQDGHINYFRNDGNDGRSDFTEDADNNPFEGVLASGGWSNMAFYDANGDGMIDAFIGESYGTIKYYRNDGTSTAPSFTEDADNNPLKDVNVGSISNIAFFDANGDGIVDAFIGSQNGLIQHTFVYPIPTAIPPADNNPFEGVHLSGRTNIAFFDADGDGLADAFIGEQAGNINYYRNNGTSSVPSFTEDSINNPFKGVYHGSSSTIAFFDANGDGLMDAFIGEQDGLILHYRNGGASGTNPNAFVWSPDDNPFLPLVDVGFDANVAFFDANGDGLVDAFIGKNDARTIKFYRNVGTSTAPSFTEDADNNPFEEDVEVGVASSVAFFDANGDGLMDAFIGDEDGIIRYYQNDGTSTAASFTENADSNPFRHVVFSGRANIEFCDVNGDGIMDAFIGDGDGNINYFVNPTVASTAPPALASPEVVTAQAGSVVSFDFSRYPLGHEQNVRIHRVTSHANCTFDYTGACPGADCYPDELVGAIPGVDYFDYGLDFDYSSDDYQRSQYRNFRPEYGRCKDKSSASGENYRNHRCPRDLYEVEWVVPADAQVGNTFDFAVVDMARFNQMDPATNEVSMWTQSADAACNDGSGKKITISVVAAGDNGISVTDDEIEGYEFFTDLIDQTFIEEGLHYLNDLERNGFSPTQFPQQQKLFWEPTPKETAYDEYADEYYTFDDKDKAAHNVEYKKRRQFWKTALGHCRLRIGESGFHSAQSEEQGIRPLAFKNVYDTGQLSSLHGPKYFAKHRSMFADGISHCSSCQDGFELVPLQTVSLMDANCVNGAECTTEADPFLLQGTGVCVKSFNAEGDKAIEELKDAVKDFVGAHVDKAHKGKTPGEEEGGGRGGGGEEAPVEISINRLETYWVISCAIVYINMATTIITLYVCCYALAGVFNSGGSKHTTMERAIQVDLVRMFSMIVLSFVSLYFFSTNVWTYSSGDDGESRGFGGQHLHNIYTDADQFMNPMFVDGSLEIKQDFLGEQCAAPMKGSDGLQSAACVHPLKFMFDKIDHDPTFKSVEDMCQGTYNSNDYEDRLASGEFCSRSDNPYSPDDEYGYGQWVDHDYENCLREGNREEGHWRFEYLQNGMCALQDHPDFKTLSRMVYLNGAEAFSPTAYDSYNNFFAGNSHSDMCSVRKYAGGTEKLDPSSYQLTGCRPQQAKMNFEFWASNRMAFLWAPTSGDEWNGYREFFVGPLDGGENTGGAQQRQVYNIDRNTDESYWFLNYEDEYDWNRAVRTMRWVGEGGQSFRWTVDYWSYQSDEDGEGNHEMKEVMNGSGGVEFMVAFLLLAVLPHVIHLFRLTIAGVITSFINRLEDLMIWACTVQFGTRGPLWPEGPRSDTRTWIGTRRALCALAFAVVAGGIVAWTFSVFNSPESNFDCFDVFGNNINCYDWGYDSKGTYRDCYDLYRHSLSLKQSKDGFVVWEETTNSTSVTVDFEVQGEYQCGLPQPGCPDCSTYCGTEYSNELPLPSNAKHGWDEGHEFCYYCKVGHADGSRTWCYDEEMLQEIAWPVVIGCGLLCLLIFHVVQSLFMLFEMVAVVGGGVFVVNLLFASEFTRAVFGWSEVFNSDSWISWVYQMQYLLLMVSATSVVVLLMLAKLLEFRTRLREEPYVYKLWKVFCCYYYGMKEYKQKLMDDEASFEERRGSVAVFDRDGRVSWERKAEAEEAVGEDGVELTVKQSNLVATI